GVDATKKVCAVVRLNCHGPTARRGLAIAGPHPLEWTAEGIPAVPAERVGRAAAWGESSLVSILSRPALFIVLTVCLFRPAGAGADEFVVADILTEDTIGDPDAWTVRNQTFANIQEVVLRFTIEGRGNFDDNLPDQPQFGFVVAPGSDFTGVSHAYGDPSSAPADFHGWRTLTLTFTQFHPGKTLVFGQDTDGSIGTMPPAFGATSGDAFAGVLEMVVTLADGRGGNTLFVASGPNASTAQVLIPEPVTIWFACLGLPLLRRRARSARRRAG
ncbi:MAG: hypothetical protein ACE5E1_06050, partial [Phycisphaerae bacterium]